jgi:hypothetical protein
MQGEQRKRRRAWRKKKEKAKDMIREIKKQRVSIRGNLVKLRERD